VSEWGWCACAGVSGIWQCNALLLDMDWMGFWWEEEGERIIGSRILIAPECIAGHPQRHLQALHTRQTRANQHNTYNDPVYQVPYAVKQNTTFISNANILTSTA